MGRFELHRSLRLAMCVGPETQTPGADDSAACEAYDADLYELLGVPREAKTIEIRHAYFKKVRACHPDKCINKSEEEKTECVLEYERYTSAYETLTDPVARACYEIATDGSDEITEEQYKRVATLKKEASDSMMPMLEMQFETIREIELNREGGGLVVISALYGNFEEPGVDSFVDVTIQVQVMVEDSKLILHREGNYCWLEGFHDPCYGEDKLLKLRYLFNEEVHECEFQDGDPIFAPLPSHSITAQQEEESRRKRWLVIGAVAAVPVITVGLYWLFGRGGKKSPSAPAQTLAISN